jgi:hypothetical protein
MAWRPMSDHKFPWEYHDVMVAAYQRGDAVEIVYVLRCTVGEHGAFFEKGTAFLSIHESGWVPFAWRIDDVPSPNATKWPPMANDYLTQFDSPSDQR